MKILHVVGNRPQFIKLALLDHAFRKKSVETSILHTGQHFDHNMSDIFFQDLSLPAPDYSLNISQLPHTEMIAKMQAAILPVLEKESPDWTVVYGDTNSTLAGALAADKLKIPLVHVEAGVRTHDLRMPEESNRIAADRLASINFCCTQTNLQNLNKEISSNPLARNVNCGDLMLDAALAYAPAALKRVRTAQNESKEPFVLATIHRAENRNTPGHLAQIVDALNHIHRQIRVRCPLHPATRQKILTEKLQPLFELLEPQGYLDMLGLTQTARAVITDSGGLSREGFFFQKPTLVLMKHPFWPEIIERGNCLRSDSVSTEIVSTFQMLMDRSRPFEQGIFGDGRAAEKMAHELLG